MPVLDIIERRDYCKVSFEPHGCDKESIIAGPPIPAFVRQDR